MGSVLRDGTSHVPRQDDAASSRTARRTWRVLERARVTEALEVDVPLVLVVAPAGSGKTVAVSSWAAQVDGPVAWVAVRRTDVAPWAEIVAALRRCGVRVPSLVALSDRDSGERALPTMLGAHVAAHREGVVLVLDCDGPVTAELADGLERVLRESQGVLRLVVLSRTEPPLELLRHRLDGTVAEVRGPDLAFRTEEVSALLDSAGLVRSREATRSLHLRTHGWAAALRFVVLDAARRGDAEEAVRELTGSGGPVAEYLRTEVLDMLPAADRRLLLDCSVADALPAGLVGELGPRGAQRRLEGLAWAFVEEQPGGFRVHEIVREMLYAELVADDPERARQLHARAAHWWAGTGRFDEATRQAARADAWPDAARYAVEAGVVADLLLDPPPTGLVAMLARMPAGAHGVGPAIVRAVVAATDGDLAEVSAQAADARAASGPVRWPAADRALDLLDLVVASGTGDAAGAVAAAERVTVAAARPDLRAAVDARRGDALLVLGRLEQAAEAYRASGCRLGRLSLVEALRGELRAARSLGERALVDQVHDAPCAHLALAWAAVESDELDLARAYLGRAVTVPVTTADPVPGSVLALLDARLRRAAGDLEAARDALTVPPDGPAWLADRVLLEQAELDLAARRPSRALVRHSALADRTSVGAERLLWQVRLAEWADGSTNPPTDPGGPLTVRVEGWLLEASRRLSLGETAAARRAVRRALNLAAPEQLRRPFREAPADVRRLLVEDAAIRPNGPPTRAGRTRTGEADEPSGELVEPLTGKEREVLGHLAAMLSTDEIAAAMFVSVNTVRTHVRNILRKMGVARRNEAVRRARALHLIPG